MDTRVKAAGIAATIVVLGGLGAGAIVFSATGEDVSSLNNGSLDKAERVALDHVGQGVVSESEKDDDGGRAVYEVEVTRTDGTQVEVDLSSSYAVLRVSQDGREAPRGDEDETAEPR